VKSNIGHTQAAAGAAGVIKMVMALRAGVLPPTLHADDPSPHIDWSGGTVRLLTREQEWPDSDHPRRGGVSSFGISGTNAHMILEEPPPGAQGGDGATGSAGGLRGTAPPGEVVPWVVSGCGQAGLRGQAARLAGFARAGCGGATVADTGRALVTGRSVFEDRAVVLAGDAAGFAAGLEAVATGQPAAGAISGRAPVGGPGKVVFVFPGQGGQWAGMAAGLAATCPAFAERLAECAAALQPHVDWPVAQTLAEPDDRALEAAEIVQPLLWAVMVALAAAWHAAGVTPDAVTGHSQGEIAAATVAGMLSVEQAARVVAVRARALGQLAGGGGMAAVAWPPAAAEEAVARFQGRIWVAAVNGPASVVLAGDRETLAQVMARAEAEGTRARWLPVDYASHGPAVDQVAAEIAEALGGIEPGPGQVPMWSSLTGEPADGTRLDGRYWAENLRRQVRFDHAVRGLSAAGHSVFIEVSPHPVLVSSIEETLDGIGLDNIVTAGTLRRGEGGPGRLLACLAEVFVRGVPVDWTAVLGESPAPRVDLPTYAFQHQRYWPVLEWTTGPAQLPVAAADGAEAGFWAAVERQDMPALAGALGTDEVPPSWLAEMAPALAAWRRRNRHLSTADRWRYQVTWQPVSGLADNAVLGGRWLLVIPAALAGSWTATACERSLAGGGVQVVILEAEAAGLDRQLLADRLRQVCAGDQAPGGIVSLLALDESECPRCAGVTAGTAATLLLVQALGDAGIGAALWVLTSGAVAAAEVAAVRIAQAQVWGLGKVAALEHPGRWGGLIDLPSAAGGPTAAGRITGWLRAILAGTAGEDQLAIRDAGVLARRLVRAPAAGTARPWRPSGPVLITGGTGALGGRVACWLAGRGAPQVVLTSRRGMAAADAAGLAARVCGAGAAITVVASDVADRADLAALWARLAAADITVRAVLHTAGTAKATALADVSLAELAEASGAKAVGARWLDELADDQVEAFVLFSSVSATWGSSGQGAYAAANAALDALAQDRRARGLPATSVAWGLWGAGGMAAGAEELLIRRGLRVMPPALAITALGQVIDRDETCTVVADIDWQQFAPTFTIARPSPLLSGVAEARQALDAETSAPGGDAGDGKRALMRSLAAAARDDQDRIVLDLVRAQTASVLGHPSADAVDSGRGFLELGFDSITAIELRNGLNAVTGLRLPATVVFDSRTPVELGQHLLAELTGELAASDLAVTAPSQRAAAAGGLGDLYNQSLRDGKSDDFLKLMKDVAGFRPAFSQSDAVDTVQPARIARGTARPGLVCFPAFVGKSDVYQYARFAAGFRGTRDVSVLPQPGFLDGERLPADLDALLEAHASAVQRCAGTDPFVLVGYSAGGLVAHAVAAHLEAAGIVPAAVVLIDTYSPGDAQTWQEARPGVEQAMLDRNDDPGDVSRGDAWVTAMARYFGFDWWDLRTVSAPTALVRATEPVGPVAAGEEWNTSWTFARTVTALQAPGNHFSLIREHAASTAQIVSEWLRAMF
jgi:acyl transferase domain-containing protein/thioesterase domain-containing protein